MAETLTAFGMRWAESTWSLLVDSALLFIIGLVLAGVVSLWLNQRTITRLVKGSPKRSVFMATLIGIPLPLCSCSVLPVAAQLRKAGLGKGATAAFLIATPETGVDSIFLTYTLTDPILTVARPLCAFLTASTAGLIEAYASNREPAVAAPVPLTLKETCDCHDGCCTPNDDPVAAAGKNSSVVRRIYATIIDLISDLAPYLFVGFVLAGLIAAMINTNPEDIPAALKTGWIGYMAALVIGLPLYVCATSSTPLAAVLLGAGFSPGAILVFLMTGPATNVATILVVHKILGLASTVRYLLVIAVTAVLSGIMLDLVYSALGNSAVYLPGEAGEQFGVASQIAAVVLALAILLYSYRWLARKVPAFSLKRPA